MWFIDSIFSLVWDITDWFWDAQEIVYDWVPPFGALAKPLMFIASLFGELLTPIANLSDWAYNVQQSIGNILSPSAILILLQYWLDRAEWAWGWVEYAGTHVTNIVDSWWSSTSQTVQVWVDTAKDYAAALVDNLTVTVNNLLAAWNNFWAITWPEWMSKFDALDAAWDNFWVETFPTLATTLNVLNLISAAFTLRESLWAGWQEMRDQVIEFFTDPLEVLWSKFADWFLGPEV